MQKLKQDDLLIPQGTTWTIQWPITNPDGTAIDTNGWTVRSQVRRNYLDATVLHEWSTALGNASVSNSLVELKVEASVSSAWDWASTPAIYDVEVTTSTGDVLRLTQGTITLSREVTR